MVIKIYRVIISIYKTLLGINLAGKSPIIVLQNLRVEITA